MNSTCTSVRAPYSTWRLQILRRLCSTAESSVGPILPFLHPRSLNQPRRDGREFHGSTARSRSNYKDVRRTERYKAALRERKGQNGVGNGSGGVPDTLEGAARKAAVPDWNPYTEESISEMQDLVGSLRDMAKIAEEKGKRLESDDDTSFLATILRRPSKKGSDSPLEDQALRRRDKGEGDGEVQLDSGSENHTQTPPLAQSPISKKKSKLPQSPFEYKSSKWQRERKAQVQEVEVDQRLENNVWAQILATDTRLEKGTKARLPRALMVDWGPMRHPETGQDYFLPIELSDLEELRQELERAKDSSENQTSPNEEGNEEKIGHKKLHRHRVRILPDRLLVQVVTGELIYVKSTRGKPEGVYQTTSKKLSALFIPYRWKHKQEEFQSFQRTRLKYNEALGLEPGSDEPDVEDMTRLDKLQWQHDIAERMEKIMQSRVLIALEAVGRDNASEGAISARKVSTLSVPKTGHLHIADGEEVTDSDISGTSEAERSSQTPPDWIHGAIFLHVGDSKLFRTTVEKWHHLNGVNHQINTADLETLPSNKLLPPMITINNKFRIPVFNLESLFGKDHATTAQQSIKTSEIFTPEFWSQKSEDTGTSPRISSTESNFNISPAEMAVPNSILDAGGQVLSSILRPSVNTNTNTAPPNCSSSKKNKNTNTTSQSKPPLHNSNSTSEGPPEEFLILIKAHAVHAAVIAREIWQLWRYIGGRTGLHLGLDAQEDENSGARSNISKNRR